MSGKRLPNFSSRKKEILISLVKKHFHILENKKTNAVFNKKKNEYWEKVANEYNALQTTGPRTAGQLKSSYEQMKKKAKQHKADDKMETLQTGGGIFVPKTTSTDEKILELIKDKYFCIDNKFDCNKNDITETTTENFDKMNEENHIIMIYADCDKSIEQSSSETYDNFLANKNILDKSQDHLVNNVNINIDDINVNGNIPNNINNEGQKRGQKRKQKCLKPKENVSNLMNNKKIELINKKICVLDIIKKAEEENLKGKILDNEKKEIIKEKELLELKQL